MKMCGATSLDQLHPGYLNTLGVDNLIPKRHDSSQIFTKSLL